MGIRRGAGTKHRVREDGIRLDSVVVVHCKMTTTLFIRIIRLNVSGIVGVVVVVCGRMDLKYTRRMADPCHP